MWRPIFRSQGYSKAYARKGLYRSQENISEKPDKSIEEDKPVILKQDQQGDRDSSMMDQQFGRPWSRRMASAKV